jgi:hypothetical protein
MALKRKIALEITGQTYTQMTDEVVRRFVILIVIMLFASAC